MSKTRLKKLLKALGVSQSELARMLGVDKSTVSRWLDGSVTISRSKVEHIKLIAEREGVRV